jgi:hypothetical protein
MSIPRIGGIATILSGQTVSNALDLHEGRLSGVNMPAAFTGTTIKIKASTDGGTTFNTVTKPDGTDITLTVAANKFVAFTDDIKAALRGVRRIQLVSGSAEAADRVVTVVVE